MQESHARPVKLPLDPRRAYASLWEEEIDASGRQVPTAVVFLTNRECPFSCVMCDLWTHTLDETVPRGAIAGQIREALSRLPPARQVKLYNAGSFFDPGAIPPEDDEEIAGTLQGFERVIVEAHPAFLSGPYADRCLRFQARIPGRFEVAVGLETAHAGVLERLNKKMTLDDFRRAAAFLRCHDIDLRVFVLLSPPFMPRGAALEWACRSIDLAGDCGSTACTVIPTRRGNPAMEMLGDEFVAPRLTELESALEYGLRAGGSLRVFADVWNIDRFCSCRCSDRRVERLRVMNREQRVPPPVSCASCEAAGIALPSVR